MTWTTRAKERPPIPIGMVPVNRRQRLVKGCWALLWLLYLAYPLSDLASGGHGTRAVVLGAIGLAAFLVCYGDLLLRRQMRIGTFGLRRRDLVQLGVMLALAVATTVTLGGAWLTLFAYTSVCAAALLPGAWGMRCVLIGTLVLVGCGLLTHTDGSTVVTSAVASFLGGAAMTGLQQLIATMRELHEARQAVAALAASDERLRLARDLHDLLGHSLSLITLKTELAGRLLDQGRTTEARAQVGDIEQVSRQALVDVREAVGGWRRPKLSVELAAARTALAAADIACEAPAEPPAGLGPDEEGALGWALREAVTNVVRHSGATTCRITLDERLGGTGRRELRLTVHDNGPGPGTPRPGEARSADARSAHARSGGHGLTGLAERLALADGDLTAAPAAPGWTLTATVPLRPAPTQPEAASEAGSAHR